MNVITRYIYRWIYRATGSTGSYARSRAYHNARTRTGSRAYRQFDANTKCVEIVDYRRHTSDCFAIDFVSENHPYLLERTFANIPLIQYETASHGTDRNVIPRLIRRNRGICHESIGSTAIFDDDVQAKGRIYFTTRRRGWPSYEGTIFRHSSAFQRTARVVLLFDPRSTLTMTRGNRRLN